MVGLNPNGNIMTEDKRHELIRDIMDKATKEQLNKLTILCLIATQTDNRLMEFHKEFMNREYQPEFKEHE